MKMSVSDKKYIMATIGPTFESSSDIKEAISNNCEWFRLPFGYRNRNHLESIQSIRHADDAGKAKVLADLPSMRPRLKCSNDVSVVPKMEFIIGSDIYDITFNDFDFFVKELQIGDRVKFLDGRIICEIVKIGDDYLHLRVNSGTGVLKSGNSISFDSKRISYVTILQEDLDLLTTIENNGQKVDWVALSMIKGKEDILFAKNILTNVLKCTPYIMAKIETVSAVENIEDILKASDGIMVARGDLSQALSWEILADTERMIIKLAKQYGKVVFVATQMLEVFSDTGVPQKSELIDIASVKWLDADGIMLGKETVFSKFPLESIKLANKIIENTTNPLLDWCPICQNSSSNLIAIEGPDGVGKTTICNMLANEGYNIIRGIPKDWEYEPLKREMIGSVNWIASAMYFLSGVIQNQKFIKKDEAIKVSDRSVWSSLVVHYKKNPKLLTEICTLLNLISPYTLFPSKVVVLDAGYKTTRERINKKTSVERELDLLLPQEEEVYYREINFFKWLKDIGICVEFVDASGNIDMVFNEVLRRIRDK